MSFQTCMLHFRLESLSFFFSIQWQGVVITSNTDVMTTPCQNNQTVQDMDFFYGAFTIILFFPNNDKVCLYKYVKDCTRSPYNYIPSSKLYNSFV